MFRKLLNFLINLTVNSNVQDKQLLFAKTETIGYFLYKALFFSSFQEILLKILFYLENNHCFFNNISHF